MPQMNILVKNELVSLFKANVIDNRLKIDNLFLYSDPKLISRLLFLTKYKNY